ncbi:UNVERIFIED_CONTAM: hypothetical protein GTU68_031477 [Idotea baltica]|nr:hypothetical protein [Idotea baltica]
MVVRHEKVICDAVNTDFGRRSAITTQASDILPVIEACEYAKKHLNRWMSPQRRKSKFPLGLIGAKSKVEYLPLGVVGNISAWNFPVQLSLAPLADIFAAGNRAMLKPSELSEHTSSLIADIVSDSFDQDELTVILGESDVAAQFSKLPFDHLLFTGSSSVGKLVAQAAAANLVPVTLELGGKNPVIVATSANIKLAAEKIIWGKVLNGGQICLSPDTVLLPQEKLSEFIECCQQSMQKMFPDIASDVDFTHAISAQHAQRLQILVDEAENAGAKVIRLGDQIGKCVPPSLVINPNLDCKIMTEEIFGGPLPIITYKDIQTSIDFINDRPKALALYYFGQDPDEIDRITHQTSSGGLVINDCFAHQMQEDLPFGGVGNSGMGAYHGFDGYKKFSHARAVFTQSKFDPLRLVRPPYGRAMRKYVAKQINRQ